MKTKYYLCSPDIAKQCCNGLEAINVYITKSGTVFAGEVSNPTRNVIYRILLKDISDEMQVLLTLRDKEFRTIRSDYFAFNPIYYYWKVL